MSSRPRFVKPADDGGWQEDKPDIDPERYTCFIFNSNLSLSLEQQRTRLPIYKSKNQILFLVKRYQVLILVGETGCGKSTQIPQYLYEAGWCDGEKLVGITEPRRVAVTSLASRVAEEKGCLLGDLVGYAIRFDDCTNPDTTRIKYMTEGLLMREMMADPLLRNYSVIMLDEVHERSLNTDILMGLLKKILKKQKNLKLIIASATVDAEKLKNFFNFNQTRKSENDTASILTVEGRLYPVEKFHVRDPVADYVKGLVDTVMKIHTNEPPGDILGFLTGQDEVDLAVSLLQDHGQPIETLILFIVPMYGSLPNSEQVKVFRQAPKGMRKVVIATNIAETSITIPGIVYVVDCGFMKVRWFNADSHTDSLLIVPISQAAAEQRAGRAGRVKPGKAFRLYPESEYEKLPVESVGEIERCELSRAVLQLKALGIENVARFDFPSPPPPRNLLAALELLHAAGAVDSECRLTHPLGYRMAEFPLGPLHAKALLVSDEFHCSQEISSILALLQVENVFNMVHTGGLAVKARVKRRNFEVAEGDLLTALNVYTAYLSIAEGERKRWCYANFVNHKAMKRVSKIHGQLAILMNQFNISLVSSKGNTEAVLKCLAAGFFPNAAYLHPSGVYKTVRGNQDLYIHPSSVLYTLQQPQWVIYCETLHTQKLFMRDITVVQPEWLVELAPHFYHRRVER